jgi:hypothetical protein
VRPPAFMADISAAPAAGGIQAARIRTEVFGAGPAQTPGIAPAAARRPHPPAGQPGSGPQVAFARGDLTARWDPPEWATPARQPSYPEPSPTPRPRLMTPPAATH